MLLLWRIFRKISSDKRGILIAMNNDLDRNQNNNLTNNELPTLPNAENVKNQQTSMESSVAMGPSFDKSKAFKYAVFYVIVSVIAIFAGVYIFARGAK